MTARTITTPPERHGRSSACVVCGTLSVLIGAMTMAGWALEIPVLQSLVPGFVSMKPNTALSFILSGTALLLLARTPTPRLRLVAARACALLVLAICGVALYELYFGLPSGFDEFLFKELLNTPRTAAPGRMAISTVMALTMVGVAIFALEWEPRRYFRPSDLLAVLVFLLAIASLVQHALTTTAFDAFFGATPMALHTSIALVALSAGILFARPDQGLSRVLWTGKDQQLERRVYRVISVTVLAFVIAGIVAWLSAMESEANARSVEHSHDIRRQLLVVLSTMQDLETGQRGYVLTGADQFLGPFEHALEIADREVNALAALDTGKSLDHSGRLRELIALVHEEIRISKQIVEARKSEGLDAATRFLGDGKRIMDSIRSFIKKMDDEELVSLAERKERQRVSVARLNIGIGVSGFFATGILLYTFVVIHRGFARQRQAEAALRASEEALATTLRSIGDGVLTTDVDGRVTGLNPVAEQLTGWTEADARGRPVGEVFRIINEITRRPAEIPVDKVLSSGQTQGLANHTVLISRDGTERPIADSAAPLHGTDRMIRGVVLVFRDITAERAVEADRSRIFALSLDMLCIAGADGYFKRVNPAFTATLGWSAEEMLARPFLDFVHPDDREATLREVERQVVAGDVVLNFENRFQHKDGTWRVLSWKSLPQPGGFMFATARDVTEHRKEQDARNLLASIVESTDDAILSKNLEGVILSWNRGAETLFGYTATEVIGQPVTKLFPADRLDEESMLLGRLQRGEKVEHFETERLRKNGEAISVSVTISPIYDGSGRILALSTIMRDISEDKMVRAQLEQAKLLAEAASRAKSEFLATMSHEIRTPMNGIIGTVDVLRQTSLRPHQIELVEIVRESAYGLLGALDDILDFSKVEAGKIELEHEPLSLAQLVEIVCDSLNPVAVRKQVDLSYFTDPHLPKRVLSDPVRLRQILNNLIGNAIKFSAGQARRGRVKVRAELLRSNTVRFVVADNGIGMPPEVLEKLFTPFTQAFSSTTRSFGGTGLGLSICRRLVDLFNGTISVESTPGQGSVFTVLLPVVVAASPDDQPEPFDLAGVNCIIVSQEPDVIADWRAYLEHAGACARGAGDLTAAAQLAAHSFAPPCVVISSDVGQSFDLDAVRARFASCPGEVRHVLVTRAYHRRPYQVAKDAVVVDGDAMRRSTFLYAVALAAGRAEPVPEDDLQVMPGQIVAPDVEEAAAQGRLILVAEDNDINQKVIRHQLATLGFACEIVGNGIDALNRWRSGRYALLLSDLQMPGLDGYQLTAAIRSEETDGKRMPIIAFTANITKGERQRCHEAGMDDYLSKPVQLPAFKAMLDKWLYNPSRFKEPAVKSLLHLDVIDKSVLPRLVGTDDPTVLADLLCGFVESASKAAAELLAAAEKQDWKATSAAAHRLKSSSRSVGALALGECCAKLEIAGNAGDSDAVMRFVPEFEGSLAEVMDAIKRETKSKQEAGPSPSSLHDRDY